MHKIDCTLHKLLALFPGSTPMYKPGNEAIKLCIEGMSHDPNLPMYDLFEMEYILDDLSLS